MSLVGPHSAIWPIVCCEPLAPATGSCLCPRLVSEQFTAFTVIFTTPILHGLKDKSGFFSSGTHLDTFFMLRATHIKGIFRCKLNPWSKTPWHQVRPPLERSSLQTTSLRSFSNLRNDRTITIHCSLCLQDETAIKKPQIMLRTATNFSNSTNRVAAYSGIKQQLA